MSTESLFEWNAESRRSLAETRYEYDKITRKYDELKKLCDIQARIILKKTGDEEVVTLSTAVIHLKAELEIMMAQQDELIIQNKELESQKSELQQEVDREREKNERIRTQQELDIMYNDTIKKISQSNDYLKELRESIGMKTEQHEELKKMIKREVAEINNAREEYRKWYQQKISQILQK